jgi:hypothetical protein
MMKTMITLMATAVLFAITTNVADAAKVNPNPIKKPPIVKFDWDKFGPDIWKKEQKCDAIYTDCIKELEYLLKRDYGKVKNTYYSLIYRRRNCRKAHEVCNARAGGIQ